MTSVSVVIPVHNREDLVAGAVRSAMEQRVENLEILVVDDASTDLSAEAARSVGGDVRVIRRERTGGPSAARNAGIAAAEGEWIAFLDSDDRWLAGSLAARIEQAGHESGIVLVSAEASKWDGERVLSERLLGASPIRPGDDAFLRLLSGNFVITSTVLARKQALIAAGGFEERLHLCEDYDLWLRVARLGQFRFLDQPAALYRVQGSGLSANVEAMFRSEVAILEALLDPERGLNPSEIAAVRRRLANLHVERGYDDMIAGRAVSARRKLRGALRRGAINPRVLAYLAASFLPPPVLRSLRRARRVPPGGPASP